MISSFCPPHSISIKFRVAIFRHFIHPPSRWLFRHANRSSIPLTTPPCQSPFHPNGTTPLQSPLHPASHHHANLCFILTATPPCQSTLHPTSPRNAKLRFILTATPAMPNCASPYQHHHPGRCPLPGRVPPGTQKAPLNTFL